ncbi:MAG: hypothetical protein NVS2B7_25170 [Herpetosiphon sp.]
MITTVPAANAGKIVAAARAVPRAKLRIERMLRCAKWCMIFSVSIIDPKIRNENDYPAVEQSEVEIFSSLDWSVSLASSAR